MNEPSDGDAADRDAAGSDAPDARDVDADAASHRAMDAVGPPVKRGGRRRATTGTPPGSDPHPTAEPRRHAASENDDRLRRDKPPHWG